ncbi:MAG TPA: FAD-binding oxidoreductase [Steroidobacteraceae bacterium]|nr:FAD-binding oxidoreductase [Steroidobacteraceae bacterium]
MPIVPAPERTPSYYTASLYRETDYPRLEGEIVTDVAIVGGGFTAIATAVELAERGLKVAVIEARKIGWGASGRNGGQVTGSLSGDTAMQKQMRRKLGSDVEDFIWRLRWRGQEIIAARVQKYGIQCDLKRGHLHAAMKHRHLIDLEASFAEAQRRGMGADVALLDAAGVREHLATDCYLGALKNLRNLHLHPLNLCIGEAMAAERLGAALFEHTEVLEIRHGPRPTLVTQAGRVVARQVLLAGDVYHKLERRQLGGKIFPAMGGIVATQPLGPLARRLNPQDLAVYDCRFVLDYYRLTADGRLLFGGGANYSGRDSRDVAAELRPAIELTFPDLKGVRIDYQWTCAMGIVINRIPQLGKLADNVWYAQGYSGHGIATSHVLAEVMAEAMTGTMGRFDVFAACRHVRVPFGAWLGNPLLAVGMWYYRLLEALR